MTRNVEPKAQVAITPPLVAGAGAQVGRAQLADHQVEQLVDVLPLLGAQDRRQETEI